MVNSHVVTFTLVVCPNLSLVGIYFCSTVQKDPILDLGGHPFSLDSSVTVEREVWISRGFHKEKQQKSKSFYIQRKLTLAKVVLLLNRLSLRLSAACELVPFPLI